MASVIIVSSQDGHIGISRVDFIELYCTCRMPQLPGEMQGNAVTVKTGTMLTVYRFVYKNEKGIPK